MAGADAVEPSVIVALVTSATSLAIAVASAVLSYSSQRRIEDVKHAHDTELGQLQNALAERSAERQARRDYEYDARKRLYEAMEPVLFQLSERSEDLQGRIIRLAKAARSGHLEPNRGWLSTDGYFLRSTIHRLLAPVALFHLMQDGLTQFDLGLDPNIRAQYAMSKVLAWAITDHYTFAECQPRLHYRPRAELENPDGDSPYQGLPAGILETAGQALIVRTASGAARVMRFGEFDEAFSDQHNPVHTKCALFATLLHDFHPRSHPVLWRVLITQAHLCASFIAARDDQRPEPMEPWNAIPVPHRTEYDWRQATDKIDKGTVLAEPFNVAQTYLRSLLGRYLQRPNGSWPDTPQLP